MTECNLSLDVIRVILSFSHTNATILLPNTIDLNDFWKVLETLVIGFNDYRFNLLMIYLSQKNDPNLHKTETFFKHILKYGSNRPYFIEDTFITFRVNYVCECQITYKNVINCEQQSTNNFFFEA